MVPHTQKFSLGEWVESHSLSDFSTQLRLL
eukprot:COSAG01_NODE_74447_length_213_cov_5.131579_1_plen_29_part_10